MHIAVDYPSVSPASMATASCEPKRGAETAKHRKASPRPDPSAPPGDRALVERKSTPGPNPRARHPRWGRASQIRLKSNRISGCYFPEARDHM
ncbi:hypothetical protein TPA0598_03_02050 [Streptomyces lydicamycinicus]|uniref:Uncharacterized protein n=1 Tax=Streptomyces lydicamycinicus TaxID=1546107 RepID=A0A0P4R496_9ACTN|nr:hypothetical protein TPA0598_03_02050 [Streptomyces lydicamycinicus]